MQYAPLPFPPSHYPVRLYPHSFPSLRNSALSSPATSLHRPQSFSLNPLHSLLLPLSLSLKSRLPPFYQVSIPAPSTPSTPSPQVLNTSGSLVECEGSSGPRSLVTFYRGTATADGPYATTSLLAPHSVRRRACEPLCFWGAGGRGRAVVMVVVHGFSGAMGLGFWIIDQ